jgi:hypothetical protein
MKLVTALPTPAFVLAPAVCKKIQHTAAQGKSLAGDIADVFGANQTVMCEIIEHLCQNGGDGKYLADVGTASHPQNPRIFVMRMSQNIQVILWAVIWRHTC